MLIFGDRAIISQNRSQSLPLTLIHGKEKEDSKEKIHEKIDA